MGQLFTDLLMQEGEEVEDLSMEVENFCYYGGSVCFCFCREEKMRQLHQKQQKHLTNKLFHCCQNCNDHNVCGE